MKPLWDEHLVQKMVDLQQLQSEEEPNIEKMFTVQQLEHLQMGGPGAQTWEDVDTPIQHPPIPNPDAPKRAPLGLKRFAKSPNKKFPKRKLEYDDEDEVRTTKRTKEQEDAKSSGVTHVVELINHNFSKQLCFLVQSYDKQTNEVILRETFGPKKIPNYLSRVMKANPKKCNEIASKMFNLLSKYDF